MKKLMVFLTIVVFVVTLAMPALGAEKPKGAPETTVPLPRLVCYIEGTLQFGPTIPNGSTIACPGSAAGFPGQGISYPVFLTLFVKNAGGTVAKGNISISGSVHKPHLEVGYYVNGQKQPCNDSPLPSQLPHCQHIQTYVDTPFSVQPEINLQPGSAVQVYSERVDHYCMDGHLNPQDFPEQIRMNAQVGGLVPGNFPVNCTYQIKINQKTQ
jgi:hypothetical protein